MDTGLKPDILHTLVFYSKKSKTVFEKTEHVWNSIWKDWDVTKNISKRLTVPALLITIHATEKENEYFLIL